VFRELGARFELQLPDGGGWDLALEAITQCGLHVVYSNGCRQVGTGSSAPVAVDLFGAEYIALLTRLNQRPLLLPTGRAEKINRLGELSTAASALASRPIVVELCRAHFPGLIRHLPNFTDAAEPGSPFLSVITRTRGTRTETLRDALLSLAGQTCQDFELIL